MKSEDYILSVGCLLVDVVVKPRGRDKQMVELQQTNKEHTVMSDREN